MRRIVEQMGHGDRKSLPGACGAELCLRLDFQRLDFIIQYSARPSLLTAAPPPVNFSSCFLHKSSVNNSS